MHGVSEWWGQREGGRVPERHDRQRVGVPWRKQADAPGYGRPTDTDARANTKTHPRHHHTPTKHTPHAHSDHPPHAHTHTHTRSGFTQREKRSTAQQIKVVELDPADATAQERGVAVLYLECRHGRLRCRVRVRVMSVSSHHPLLRRNKRNSSPSGKRLQLNDDDNEQGFSTQRAAGRGSDCCPGLTPVEYQRLESPTVPQPRHSTRYCFLVGHAH